MRFTSSPPTICSTRIATIGLKSIGPNCRPQPAEDAQVRVRDVAQEVQHGVDAGASTGTARRTRTPRHDDPGEDDQRVDVDQRARGSRRSASRAGLHVQPPTTSSIASLSAAADCRRARAPPKPARASCPPGRRHLAAHRERVAAAGTQQLGRAGHGLGRPCVERERGRHPAPHRGVHLASTSSAQYAGPTPDSAPATDISRSGTSTTFPRRAEELLHLRVQVAVRLHLGRGEGQHAARDLDRGVRLDPEHRHAGVGAAHVGLRRARRAATRPPSRPPPPPTPPRRAGPACGRGSRDRRARPAPCWS